MEAVHLINSQNALGEGPLWSIEEQALYWVDIEGKTINRYSAETKQHEILPVNAKVSVIAFREQGGFVTAGSRGFSFWAIGNTSIKPFIDPKPNLPNIRFNDGKVDRAGRFWAGTMTPDGAFSSLYRMDPSLAISEMESGITISNGIAWSPDNKTMYYADSLRYTIYAYDFDLASGNISNRRDWIKFESSYGIPDGLTVDSEGYVWVAFYFGWKVVRFDPGGKVDTVIKLPVSAPTSCCFGGKDLTELYITSAKIDLSEDEEAGQPLAGDIFMVKTETNGLPEPKFTG